LVYCSRFAVIAGSVHGHHRQSATLRSWCSQPSLSSSRFEEPVHV